MMKMRALLFLCSFVLCSRVVVADDFSVFTGWAGSDDLKLSLEEIEFGNAAVFGARFENSFFDVLGFENSIAYTRNMISPSGSSGGDGIYYSGNMVLNFPVSRVVPNVTFGLGLLYRAGSSFPDVGGAFLTNWGGGIKIRELSGPFGLRFDYRRFKYYGVEDQNLGAHELSGGLLFSF